MTFLEPIQQIKMSFWSRSDMFPMFLFPLPEKKNTTPLKRSPTQIRGNGIQVEKSKGWVVTPKNTQVEELMTFVWGGKESTNKKMVTSLSYLYDRKLKNDEWITMEDGVCHVCCFLLDGR